MLEASGSLICHNRATLKEATTPTCAEVVAITILPCQSVISYHRYIDFTFPQLEFSVGVTPVFRLGTHSQRLSSRSPWVTGLN